MTIITSTEFTENVSAYSDAALLNPVYITNDKREDLVLVAAEYFERLKAFDTRQALLVQELSDDTLKEMEVGYQGDKTPELDHLLK